MDRHVLDSLSEQDRAVADNLVEGTETATLTIQPSANYNVGTPNSVTLTIIDSNGGPPPGDTTPPTVSITAPANNATVRSVFVIGPDKKIKTMLTYPMTTGRNFDEVLRILDSVQLTAKHPVATPVNWKPGGDVIIAGSVSDEEAQKRYPGFRAPKPYLRYTAQPR